MMKYVWVTVVVLLAGALAWAAKPATMRIAGENVVAQIAFEKGLPLRLTSKPVPVTPDTYWTKSLSLFKQDDQKRAWELRSTGNFGSLANVTVDAEQDKVLLLGKALGLRVEARPADDAGVKVVAVSVGVIGQNGETYWPWAYLDGKTHTMPAVTIKDEAGKVLAQGPCVLRDNVCRFDWRYPAGFKSKFDVDVAPVLGPFEFKVSKTIEPPK